MERWASWENMVGASSSTMRERALAKAFHFWHTDGDGSDFSESLSIHFPTWHFYPISCHAYDFFFFYQVQVKWRSKSYITLENQPHRNFTSLSFFSAAELKLAPSSLAPPVNARIPLGVCWEGIKRSSNIVLQCRYVRRDCMESKVTFSGNRE